MGGTSTGVDSEDDVLSCETWNDMCPEGQKCIPYVADGAIWDAQGCFAVDSRPGSVGDSCTMMDSEAGTTDTCEKGLLCWDSRCMPLCQGTPAEFSCPDGYACGTINMDTVAICLPACDPRMPTCNADSDVCSYTIGIFECVEGGDLGLFAPCKSLNACANGLLCLSSMGTAECDQEQESCCTELCTTVGPATCQGNGQKCMPFTLPNVPEYQNLGYCSI